MGRKSHSPFRGVYFVWVCLCCYFAPAADPAEVRITNLGSSGAFFAGDWLVYQLQEAFRGEDLNGDDDREDWVLHLRNLVTGRTTNLGLSGSAFDAAEKLLVITVSETSQRADLNGDGDTDDRVIHVHDLARGETTNLRAMMTGGLFHVSGDWIVTRQLSPPYSEYLNISTGESGTIAGCGPPFDQSCGRIVGSFAVAQLIEELEREDLNGDGDMRDWFVALQGLATGEPTNLGLQGIVPAVRGYKNFQSEQLVIWSSEGRQGEDQNGDGDTKDGFFSVHDTTTGETRTLPFAVEHDPGDFEPIELFEDWLLLPVAERQQGEDLNGDGDTDDFVAHFHNLSTGETVNPGRATAFPSFLGGHWVGYRSWDQNLDKVHFYNLSTGQTRSVSLSFSRFARTGVSGNWAVFGVSESGQGEDLNGDGDTEDGDWQKGTGVAHAHNLSTGRTTNVGLAANMLGSVVSGESLVLGVLETDEDRDLNGDGDTEDTVLHLHHLPTGQTTNLGLAGRPASFFRHYAPAGRAFIIRVSESEQGEDLNGDGDLHDRVAHLVELAETEVLPSFLRGDCNGDGTVDISDAVFSLGSLFLGDGDPGCDDACDSNDDGAVDISDAIVTLAVLFLGNGVIPLPGMTNCGVDPTGDELDCGARSSCQ